MDISKATTNELKSELEKRLLQTPKVKKEIWWGDVVNLCHEYIDYIESDSFHDDNDYEYYFYASVIEAVFGKEFWDWYNKKVNG